MWRLRTEIYTEAILETGTIECANVIIKITEFTEENSENWETTKQNFRLCDIFLIKDEKDILEAFAILYNEINCFIDRLSLVSYGKSGLSKILSIAPESVKLGEIFEIAVPQVYVERKTNNIALSNLKYDISLTSEQQRWERLLRIGLNSMSEEEKYISYYSLLEEIARHECQEFIITKCDKCNHEVNTGRKKTNNFIKTLLGKHGVDKKTMKNAEIIRNEIAHGGAKKDKSYFVDVARIGSNLEEICLIELEQRFGIDIINRLNIHVSDIPMFVHKLICISDKDCDFIESKHFSEPRFVKLQHTDESKFESQQTMIGVMHNGRPQIYDIAYPIILFPINKLEESVAYQNIGELYYIYKEQDSSIKFYLKALNIVESFGEKEAMAVCYTNLGNAYQQKNNKAEAKRYYQMSINLFRELNSPLAITVQNWLKEMNAQQSV